jgi:hypothetical protein
MLHTLDIAARNGDPFAHCDNRWQRAVRAQSVRALEKRGYLANGLITDAGKRVLANRPNDTTEALHG